MHWTWDHRKAAENVRKHRVSFQLAERVFADPFAVTLPDPFPYESRWRTIGVPGTDWPVLLLVVHTWPEAGGDDDVGRIISARRAEPHERRAYAEGKF
ncbi:MAG: BrnT family toxin [Alphaproteobacteria bacterium]|nr:BrnT family toxin [Alphaproteobacteria bacterium]